MITTQKKSNSLNRLLWITQALVAAIFLWAGILKLVQPDTLPFPWIKDYPTLVFLTGMVDVLGGLGLLLPAILRVKPGLTILAAYGIMALMLVASVFHILRGEAKDIGFNIFVLLLAVFIAWGRSKKAPFIQE